MTGYAVGQAGHTTAAGAPVWYGGGRLAPDLTLPRLRTRWITPLGAPGPTTQARSTAAPAFPPPPGVYQEAADTIRVAAADMAAATDQRLAASIASAAADVLDALARGWGSARRGPLTEAADLFDRAAHDRHYGGTTDRGSRAIQLRAMVRPIGLMGRISRDPDRIAALYLIHAFAALAENLADLRKAQQRLHQAQTARAAAAQLRAYTSLPAMPHG